MTQFNSTTNPILGASERELINLSVSEIMGNLIDDYKSFSRGTEAGIRIPDNKKEDRMSHACILYAEGLRMAHSHHELANKLILASLYDLSFQIYGWLETMSKADLAKKNIDILETISEFPHYSNRPFAWLRENGEADELENFLKDIKAFEDFKAAERKKKEHEKEK